MCIPSPVHRRGARARALCFEALGKCALRRSLTPPRGEDERSQRRPFHRLFQTRESTPCHQTQCIYVHRKTLQKKSKLCCVCVHIYYILITHVRVKSVGGWPPFRSIKDRPLTSRHRMQRHSRLRVFMRRCKTWRRFVTAFPPRMYYIYIFILNITLN